MVEKWGTRLDTPMQMQVVFETFHKLNPSSMDNSSAMGQTDPNRKKSKRPPGNKLVPLTLNKIENASLKPELMANKIRTQIPQTTRN